MNHLTQKLLRKGKLPNSPDKNLAEWLEIISDGHKGSPEELGAKIGLALQENDRSWLLATAAAIYWRLVGDSQEAIVCLKLALDHVPEDKKDVPLISLANLLHRFLEIKQRLTCSFIYLYFRIGLNGDALEVAYLALKTNPNFVVNHFTIGNILTSMGDLEEAISFHRAALALDSNFEPARNRLQAILCTLLFDEAGSVRSIPEN